MFFYASKLISVLIWPSNVITMVLLAGVVLLIVGKAPSLARRLLIAGVVLHLACGFGPIGNWLILPLEQRFERGVLPGEVAGVIILGGFEQGAITAARDQLNLNDSADRLTESIRLAFGRPGAKIIFTGGDAALIGPAVKSAAEPIGAYMEAVGIARERIVLEGRSRTTWENALFLHDILKPAPGQRYVLVTSAFHMPRSVGTFRKVGFDVVAWPVDYRTRGLSDALTLSNAAPGGLERVDLAFKEWVGLVAYRLSGRTSELWPASGGGATSAVPGALPLPRG